MEPILSKFKNDDPIKLGITLHFYADTFFHQGFYGIATKVSYVYLADDFLQSNWYKYYQGIQSYKEIFFKAAEANGLSIPNSYN